MRARDGRDVLALIPARGGSKGIPRKNIAVLAGRTLIEWTIDAARESGVFRRIVVSTDDAEIAEVALGLGAEVPFRRPAALASDDTAGIDPVVHALRWLAEHEKYSPRHVMMLQPTSPLRAAADIRAALELAEERDADSVVSVCPASQHPYWTKAIAPDGRLLDFLSVEGRYPRRQDLPPAWVLNGAIYLARSAVVVDHETFYTDRTYAYVMPPERSLDIDTALDFRIAEFLLRNPCP